MAPGNVAIRTVLSKEHNGPARMLPLPEVSYGSGQNTTFAIVGGVAGNPVAVSDPVESTPTGASRCYGDARWNLEGN